MNHEIINIIDSWTQDRVLYCQEKHAGYARLKISTETNSAFRLFLDKKVHGSRIFSSNYKLKLEGVLHVSKG